MYLTEHAITSPHTADYDDLALGMPHSPILDAHWYTYDIDFKVLVITYRELLNNLPLVVLDPSEIVKEYDVEFAPDIIPNQMAKDWIVRQYRKSGKKIIVSTHAQASEAWRAVEKIWVQQLNDSGKIPPMFATRKEALDFVAHL